jgi:hypothetical protein
VLTSAPDDRAVMLFPDPVCRAVQVEESACGGERGAPASAERTVSKVTGFDMPPHRNVAFDVSRRLIVASSDTAAAPIR